MSVRGERVVYRERDRSSDDSNRRTYTTVKRYAVPDRRPWEDEQVTEDKKVIIRRTERSADPSRSDFGGRRGSYDEIDIKIKERERERDSGRRSEFEDVRYSDRVVERERDREPRRDISYRVVERDTDVDDRRRSDFGRRSEFREVDRKESRVASPPSEHVREFRFERERDFGEREVVRSRSRSRSNDRSAYDVKHYSKSTEYYQQPTPVIIRESAPAAPQPIIIRDDREPIIIREDRRPEHTQTIIIREREREREREPQYEFVEREEVKEKSVVLSKHSESPPPAASTVVAPVVAAEAAKAEGEDYYYERRIREVERPRREERERSRHSDDERWERRSVVRPRDSASQASDGSYEYVRRERVIEQSRSRSHSPHHKRHLAEGAIAGVGVAEIIRHHRKGKGQEPGHRGRQLIGGAAAGAIGAEAISRVSRSLRRPSRSRSRRYSSDRERSYSGSRERRRHRHSRSRSRSRSRSKSRARQLGSIAAIAAVGALAGYALKNRNKGNETVIVNQDGRRRHRRRQSSLGPAAPYDRDIGDTAMNPEHRNRRIAQAGLASAAAAGIWEKVRSRSKGGRERSKSRLRTGVPIAAAGLGGAALAGLYERNKASKEATRDAIAQEEMGRGRRRSSRSRSRSVGPGAYPYSDDGRAPPANARPDLVAYGEGPVYPDERGYYSDEEPGSYHRRHGRSMSRGSSPDTRDRSRMRSRSRGRNFAEAGAAAGVAAVAAHEMGRRRERNKQSSRSRSRRRYEDEYPPYEDAYGPNGGYPQNAPAQNYPGGNYFPPPPTQPEGYVTNEPAYEPSHNPYSNPIPPYNPADYAHQPAPAQNMYNQSHGAYNQSDATLGAPYPGGETYAGDPRFSQGYGGQPGGYQGGSPAYGAGGQRRNRGHDDVSSPRASTAAPDAAAAAASAAAVAAHQQEAERKPDADGLIHDEARRARQRERAQPGDATADEATSAPADEQQRPRSLSRVRFNLANNESFAAEQPTRRRDFGGGDDDEAEGGRRRHRRRHDDERHSDTETTGDRRHRRRRRRGDAHDRDRDRGVRNDENADGYGSDGTIELPDRFDEHGNRKPEDPLAARIQDMLEGRGGFGGILRGLMGEHGGDGDAGRRGSEGDAGRRRRR